MIATRILIAELKHGLRMRCDGANTFLSLVLIRINCKYQKNQLLIIMCEREDIPLTKLNWSDVAHSLQRHHDSHVRSVREIEGYWCTTMKPYLESRGIRYGGWADSEVSNSSYRDACV